MGVTELSNDFKHKVPMILKNGKWVDDVVNEDTQFASRHKNGK